MNPGRSAETMTCLPRSAASVADRASVVTSSVAVPRIELDERHHRDGAEEVHPDEARPAIRAHRRREPVDRDRARVRREDRVRRGDPRRARPTARDLTSTSSNTASTTRSRPAGGGEPVGRGSTRASTASRSLGASAGPWRPPARGCRRSAPGRPRPGRAPARRGPTAQPTAACTWAMPWPIRPAPATNDPLDRHESRCPARRATSEQPVRGRVRIERVVGHLAEGRRGRWRRGIRDRRSAPRTRSATIAHDLAPRPARAGPARPGSAADARGGDRRAREQLRHARAGRRGRDQDLGPLGPRPVVPVARSRGARGRQHRPQLAGRPSGARPVALVDDDDVGHLEQAGLDRLDLVAHLGRLEDDRRVGRGGHLDLALAGAHRLDEDRGRSPPRRARPPRPRRRRRGRRRGRARPSSG